MNDEKRIANASEGSNEIWDLLRWWKWKIESPGEMCAWIVNNVFLIRWCGSVSPRRGREKNATTLCLRIPANTAWNTMQRTGTGEKNDRHKAGSCLLLMKSQIFHLDVRLVAFYREVYPKVEQKSHNPQCPITAGYFHQCGGGGESIIPSKRVGKPMPRKLSGRINFQRKLLKLRVEIKFILTSEQNDAKHAKLLFA